MQPLDLWPTAARRDLVGVFTDIVDTLTTEGDIAPAAPLPSTTSTAHLRFAPKASLAPAPQQAARCDKRRSSLALRAIWVSLGREGSCMLARFL